MAGECSTRVVGNATAYVAAKQHGCFRHRPFCSSTASYFALVIALSSAVDFKVAARGLHAVFTRKGTEPAVVASTLCHVCHVFLVIILILSTSNYGTELSAFRIHKLRLFCFDAIVIAESHLLS